MFQPTGSNTTNQLEHWLDPNSAGAGFVDGFDPGDGRTIPAMFATFSSLGPSGVAPVLY